VSAAIEKALGQSKSHIIDHATLSNILTNYGYISIKDKIESLKKKSILKSLKKGLYIHTSQYSKNIVSKEIVANSLLSPSYVSFDYALYYHGLIPESVVDVASATTKRSKSFSTDYGVFSFRQIKKELFHIGLKIESGQNGNYMIATKEKALCDKVYFTRDIKIGSKRDMIEFLMYDLRVDFDELDDFDIEIVKKYQQVSKSKKIKFLEKVIESIV